MGIIVDSYDVIVIGAGHAGVEASLAAARLGYKTLRRKSLGYTQKYISEYTGLSITFISDLENGKNTIEFGKALKLADLLGLDVAVTERG